MARNQLERLKNSIFTAREAEAKGISRRMLSYLLSKGLISRLSQGVYAKAGEENQIDQQSLFRRILIEAPQAVIGRLSALKFYGLLDEDPPAVELIAPGDNIPKRKIEDAEIFRAPRKSIHQGIEKKGDIRVTSLDRTLIECLRNDVPLNLVIRAFHEAQRRGLKPSLSQMEKFARVLRVQGKFKVFREAIL